MRARLGVVAGVGLLVAAFGYCVRTFLDERERVADALASASFGWLAVGFLAAGAAMGWLAVGWSRCLRVLGETVEVASVVRWYFVGELGKYVPGGIWPVVGRGELARRGGVPRVVAYSSVALSLAAWYGAAVLPVAVLAAHPRVQRVAGNAGRRVSGGRIDLVVLRWRSLVGLLVSYLPTWALVGGVTVAVGHAYGAAPGGRAVAAAALAWVCGFVAVPIPAGAGVREAVFVATSGLPAGVGLTVAITSRLLFVAVDLLGAGIAAPSLRGGRMAGGDGEHRAMSTER